MMHSNLAVRTCIALGAIALFATEPSRLVAGVALPVRTHASASTPAYTLVDLDALVGGGSIRFVPTALNNLGQIAGYDSQVPHGGVANAGAAYVIDADRTVHVLQATGVSQEAYIPLAISSDGRGVAAEGTILDETGPDTWLRNSAGSYGLRYRRFNGSAPITGLTDGNLGVGGPNYYGITTYVDTPFPSSGCALGSFFANDVNDAGTIVGSAGGYAAEDTLTGCSSYISGIPRPTNASTTALAINARGSLLGSFVGPAAPAYGSYYLVTGGRTTRISLPAAYASTTYYASAVALSDDDAVVGNVVQGAPPFSPVAPFLFRNGRSIDVNTLLPAASGWRLVTASAVNASGEIVGTGYYGGVLAGYALVP